MEPLLPIDIAVPARSSGHRQSALYEQLRDAILTGRLAAGLKLPSSRALAERLRVSRNTVLGAYDRLLAEGYVESRRGAGSFVSSLVADQARSRPVRRSGAFKHFTLPPWTAPQRKDKEREVGLEPRISFALGIPDWGAFPGAVWSRLESRLLASGVGLRPAYGSPEGSERLRSAIARHVSRTRAVACSADDIVVTSGAQQAFDLLARVLASSGDAAVAVEDPGYHAFRAPFVAVGARILPTPVDEHGLVVDAIPALARIIYVTPSHQFPLGVAMSFARRQALLDRAGSLGAVIIEDDYDSEFRFDGRPLDALKVLDRGGRVIYVGSFSKCMYPGIRLGYIVAPEWLRAALISAKRVSDPHIATLAAEALAEFLEQGHLARHIRRMTRVYERRRNAILRGLSQYFAGELRVLPSSAGLHVSVAVGASPGRLAAWIKRSYELGVGVSSFTAYTQAAPSWNGVALGYGALSERQIDEGVRMLAKAWRATS